MKLKINTTNLKSLQPQHAPYEAMDTDLSGFLLRVQPSGVMTYYFAYRTADGKKKRCKIGRYGTLTPIQARDEAIKLSAKVISGEDVQDSKNKNRLALEKGQMCTLKNFLAKKYEPWLIADRKSGRENISLIHYYFKDFLTLPLHDLKPNRIEKWRMGELNKGKKASTINRNLTRLKSLLSKAIEWEYIDHNPLAKLKNLKVRDVGKVRYLTIEEEKNLRIALDTREHLLKSKRTSANEWRKERGYKAFPDLNHCFFADYLKPMVLLSINTGLRRGELFNLTWQDIDFTNPMITILGTNTKNGKTRYTPLNNEALSILKNWQAQTSTAGFIFPAKDKGKLTHIRKSWASILEEAKITEFRWHDLRHHFASKLATAGVDLNTIRELLGHADLTMTLRYAHLAPEHKAAAVAKLNQLEPETP